MGTNDRNDNNSDDSTLFRDAVGEIKPIKGAKRFRDIGTTQRRPRRDAIANNSTSSAAQDAVDRLPESDSGFGMPIKFKRDQVSRQRMRELSRGKLRIEAAIDLHGLRAERAERELMDFLSECHSRRLEVIRVVHGKGYGSGDRGPVLKALSNRLLRSHDAVLAFCSALDRDGGTGALYVLLEQH